MAKGLAEPTVGFLTKACSTWGRVMTKGCSTWGRVTTIEVAEPEVEEAEPHVGLRPKGWQKLR